MIPKLREVLILIATFIIIYWFQRVDDKKRCKPREGIYHKIKLPLLATSIVGLVLFWDRKSCSTSSSSSTSSTLLITSTKLPIYNESFNPIIQNNSPIHQINNIESPINNIGNHPDFDVYTGIPQW